MKYVHYEESTGKLLGRYDSDIHADIPLPNIEVNTQEWEDSLLLNANHIDIVNRLFSVKDFRTQAEIDLHNMSKVVTMRQARLALLQQGLLQTVTDAIANGTDEAMKIEWEYATEVRRDWPSLIALATSLGLTSQQLDNLFTLASTL